MEDDSPRLLHLTPRERIADDEILIPSSLRPVAPFLEEAQAILRNVSSTGHRTRVGIYCIDHAFELLGQYKLPLDDIAKETLQKFKERRDILASHTRDLTGKHAQGIDITNVIEAGSSGEAVKLPPERVLLIEAKETLELADEQLKEGLNKDAARNFHTATVYFRVLENLVPSLSTEVHSLLEYSSNRTRECSHLLENFVHEHFEGRRFSSYYDINEKERLGKGSYGSVYLCRHKRTNDAYACKVISINRISSHYLRKLHVEIAIMKEVDHPNIVKLREVFFGSRTVYLVMDLCQGGELFEELTVSHKRGFDEPHAAHILQDMISAVGYLHHHGIVHRDLKLENFLFETKSVDSNLKLIDFGLSKHFHDHEQMHQVVGSAYYTAPEVLAGQYDHRCDIWSLGIIAYMMLSGSPPFYGDSSEVIHNMIQSQEAEYPEKRFKETSPEALDFLKKLLVKDPDSRINLDVAMQHPFVKKADNMILEDGAHRRTEPSNDVVLGLKGFMEMSKFKQMVMGAVAFTLSPIQIAELKEEFHAIDTDHSGTISMAELRKSMATIKGLSEGGDAVSDMFKDMSVSDDAEINYNDFVAAAMVKRIAIDEERLHLAFETLDIDGCGFLDYESIKKAVGGSVPDDEIHQMLLDIDEDGDGKIDYKEFMHFWKKMMLQQRVNPTKRLQKAARKISKSLTMFKSLSRKDHSPAENTSAP